MAETSDLNSSNQRSIRDELRIDRQGSRIPQRMQSASDRPDGCNGGSAVDVAGVEGRGLCFDHLSPSSPPNSVDIQDFDLRGLCFDHLSPPSPRHLSSLLPSLSSPCLDNVFPNDDSEAEDSESDSPGSVCDPIFGLGYEEEEEVQVNFVTNLFESREAHLWGDSNLISDVLDSMIDDSDSVFCGTYEGGFDHDHINELGLGFVAESGGHELSDFSGSHCTEIESSSAFSGLRVVGIDSDSDSEVLEVNSVTVGDVDDEIYEGTHSDLPIFLESLRLTEQRNGREEFDWEEVFETAGERDGPSSVVSRVDAMSASSETSLFHQNSGDAVEEAVSNLEWEILLAANNLDRTFEFEANDRDGDDVPYLAVQDDYIYGAEYDTLFGQFVEGESALKGSPPASKTLVENLPSVVLTEEDLKMNSLVCAVCKEDITVEEKVTKLPCQHHYHGDCVVPWLTIRNTCPVCRYELPTDDAEYERKKSGRAGHSYLDGLVVRYNFEVLP